MVNVVSQRCARPGCNKYVTCRVKGSKKAGFCTGHAVEEMVGIRKPRRSCGGKSSSREQIRGDVNTRGASATDLNADRVAKGTKRKASALVPAQSEASSDSERSDEMAGGEQEEEMARSARAICADGVSPHEGVLSSRQYPAAVKVEDDVAMSLSSAAAAVRYVEISGWMGGKVLRANSSFDKN